MWRCAVLRGQNLLHEVQSAIDTKPILASSPFPQRRQFLVALRQRILEQQSVLARASHHDSEAFIHQAGVLPSSTATAAAPREHGAARAAPPSSSPSTDAATPPAPESTEASRVSGLSGPYSQSAFTSRPSHAQQLSPLRVDKVCATIDYLLQQPDPIALPPSAWLAHSWRTREQYATPERDGAAGHRGSTAAASVETCELRVPLGLVGVLSRYRPRLCVDAASMGIFAGNAVLLDGGAALCCTNAELFAAVRHALLAAGLPSASAVLVESYDMRNRLTAQWLGMVDRVDVALVCGPPKLYSFACKHAAIPLVRATSRSNTLFIDESALYDTALRVVMNAKKQSPGAANAVTTIILHARFPRYVELLKDLADQGIVLVGDSTARERAPDCIAEIASDEEYRGLAQGLRDLARTLCVKTVSSVNQALLFLELFGSRQTDGIVATDESVIMTFCRCVDSAVVLVNASTRLSSGESLGCGPDLAIATSKAHCRGPITLDALTTRKFVMRSVLETGAVHRGTSGVRGRG